MDYLSLFCYSHLVVFLIFIMTLRFFAAPPQIQPWASAGGSKGAFSPLEIGSKKQKFPINVKSAT